MKKIFVLTTAIILIISLNVSAQRSATKRGASSSSSSSNYTTALGVKFLDGAGITLKHFVNDKAAIEAIGYFWNRGARITGLYEFHFDIAGAQGLKWYVGPGAHIGFYNNRYWDRYGNKFGNRSFGGIDGVLGLDYKVKSAPLNFSLDWQPSFEFGENRGFIGSWGGFAIRFTF